MEIIKVKDLSFRYPNTEKKAIDKVSFEVEQGEFVVFCGESGCGKTTLLKLLKRELTPFGEKEGSIYYKGVKQEDLSEREASSEIGFVMQNPENQVVTDKVWHELAFGLENIGCPRDTIRRRVGEMASFFGIQEWFRKKTSELSGGQKQLLNLASIMVMQPDILILDEPTSQLDPIAAADFIGTLHKLNKDLGLTILLVEHRLEEVFPIADQVVVMENGKILLYDTPRMIGKRLQKEYGNHKMIFGLPSAVRIYNGVEIDTACPMTIREGREFLQKHFRNDIPKLERKEEVFTQNPIAIELKNISFRYERDLLDILEQVKLKVYKGEIVSILGGNGSGKTTLLNAITGQNRVYKGKIFIHGKRIKEYKGNSLFKENLAVLPQNPQTVFLKSTVFEDYKEILKIIGINKKDIEEEILKIAELLDINHLLQKHPYDLSGGEQQKAALGKVLLLKPKVLLMDEPTKGLDAFFKRNLEQILFRLQKEGMTILFVTHDVEFAAHVSNRCCLFFDREIVSCDTPVKFFSNNNFYTTAANRISRQQYEEAITCEDVIELMKLNGGMA